MMRLLDGCGVALAAVTLVGGCVQVVEPLADVDEDLGDVGTTGASAATSGSVGGWGGATGAFGGGTIGEGSNPGFADADGFSVASTGGEFQGTIGGPRCSDADAWGPDASPPRCHLNEDGTYDCLPSEGLSTGPTSQCFSDPEGNLVCMNLTDPGVGPTPREPACSLGGPCYFDGAREDYVCESPVDGTCIYYANGDYGCDYIDGSGEAGGRGPQTATLEGDAGAEACVRDIETGEIRCGVLVGSQPCSPPVVSDGGAAEPTQGPIVPPDAGI